MRISSPQATRRGEECGMKQTKTLYRTLDTWFWIKTYLFPPKEQMNSYLILDKSGNLISILSYLLDTGYWLLDARNWEKHLHNLSLRVPLSVITRSEATKQSRRFLVCLGRLGTGSAIWHAVSFWSRIYSGEESERDPPDVVLRMTALKWGCRATLAKQ